MLARRARLTTDPARRKLMQRVRQRGTPAEKAVAEVCRELSLHYRLNVRSLAGSPDLANKSRRWAIFVHGCFWHQHPGCPKATMPKRNAAFWRKKFAANRERDARKVEALRAAGYRVAIVWECETSDRRKLRGRLQRWPKRLS
jgi:DNA mismatch endonuclease (patch repair protein)